MTDLAVLTAGSATRCTACGSDIAAGILACPGCHRLVHADALKGYRDQATLAAASGDREAELTAWRLALDLLPPHSKQYATVVEKIESLSDATMSKPAAPVPQTGAWKWLSGLGALGLLLWKFKFIVVALATKGKLLFLGLTKATTVFSMLLSFGVYWTAWGMWFAAGIVLSIYIHEIGHIAALKRFGIQTTSPMFIPGLGAFIRMRGRHLSPREDARIGLAGPIWGLGAALVALAVARAGGGPMWVAIAHTGAWINLFNLLPVWQLDGSRGMAALTRSHRWLVVAAFAGGWLIAGDGLFVLLIVMAGIRAATGEAPELEDRSALAQFVFVILALAVVFKVAA